MWSEARVQRGKARPIPATEVDGGAHERTGFGAVSIADAQPPPEGKLERRVRTQAAAAGVDIKGQGERVQHKERSQGSADLVMLRWHSIDYDDEVAAMADIFDSDVLMQGCNALTLETDGSRVVGCPNGRGVQRAPGQSPSPRTGSGGISYECGGDISQQMPEYMDMLSAYANAAEESKVAQAVPEGPTATHHSSTQSLRVRGPSNAASRFLAATQAHAAMSRHELEALGYTDCDLSYLVVPTAPCCRT